MGEIRELWFKGALDLGMKPFTFEEEGPACMVKLVRTIEDIEYRDGPCFRLEVTWHVWNGDRHLYAGTDVREALKIYKELIGCAKQD